MTTLATKPFSIKFLLHKAFKLVTRWALKNAFLQVINWTQENIIRRYYRYFFSLSVGFSALQSQIRKQMRPGAFLGYEKSILSCGLWAGLDWTVKKKGLGRLWATFEAHFLKFSWVKNQFRIFWKYCRVRTVSIVSDASTPSNGGKWELMYYVQ